MTLYGSLGVDDVDYWRLVVQNKETQVELLNWLSGYGVDPCDVWRFEVHILDGLVLRVFEFDKNDEGYWFPSTEDLWAPAQRKPYDVLIRELPPVQIRRVGVDA